MLGNDLKFCRNLSNFALYLTFILQLECFSIPDPECISCDKYDQVFNEDGEFLRCDSDNYESDNYDSDNYDSDNYDSDNYDSDNYDTEVRDYLITGLDFCEDGQVKDTRGECKTAYKFSPPKEERKPETRSQKPRRRRNLRKYLQSRYRF